MARVRYPRLIYPQAYIVEALAQLWPQEVSEYPGHYFVTLRDDPVRLAQELREKANELP